MLSDRLFALAEYISYLRNAKSKYYIHSPFVFSFINEVLYAKDENTIFISFEEKRNELLKNKQNVEPIDYGAGSKAPGKNFTVASVANTSLKKPKWAKLFYRIIIKYELKNVIELGTSLGITTCYLSAANEDGKVFTIEGNRNIAEIAEQNFRDLNRKNIFLQQGNFNELLPIVLNELKRVDFLFIDGNHSYEPTIKYFSDSLFYLNDDSVVVIDDIHWSREMKKAWLEIQHHPKVKTTIDLYYFGIVFFKKELSTEHFILKA
jgi:predicted O-methyltransferase YrrM